MTHLFTLLQKCSDGALSPDRCKLHLATPPDNRTNLCQLLATRKFDEWLSYQTNRKWSREFVVALIKDCDDDPWIFAGACVVDGLVDDDTPEDRSRVADEFCMPREWFTACRYRLRRLRACDALIGTIVRFHRRVQTFHLFAEKVAPQLEVHEEDQKD